MGRGPSPKPTLPPPDRLGLSLLVATLGLACKQAGKVGLGPHLGLGWGAGVPGGLPPATLCHKPPLLSLFSLPLPFPSAISTLEKPMARGLRSTTWPGLALP